MNKQISIAQSELDAQIFFEIIAKKYDIKFLPKFFKDKNIHPKKFGGYHDDIQMIFLDEFEEIVLSNINPLTSDTDTFQIFPFEGLCIEWQKTKHIDNKNYSGRFYYKTNGSISFESEVRLGKVYNSMATELKKYKFKSTDKIPTYIGNDLARQILEGSLELNWRNGLKKNITNNK